jgi:signal transduction histidine kinase
MYNLRDYKAYEYQEFAFNIKDELRDKEVRRMVETITASTNFKTGKDLGIKEEEVKRLKEQAKNSNMMQLGIVIIAFLILAIGYLRFRQVKLSRSKLIQEKKLEQLKSESQTRILDATLEGKEKERKQIAETLHDSVSALLSSANLHLQASASQYNGSTPLEIVKTQKIITQASQEVRDLSHTLFSSVLLKFGLSYAIKDIAEMYSNSQIEIHTDLYSIARYSQDFEIKVYNIIQELINNVLKHSKAQNAIVLLKEWKGILKIIISDDGQGFDKKKITDKEGLGINQIAARVHMLKGVMIIETEEGEGTKIKINLPIINVDKPINFG